MFGGGVSLWHQFHTNKLLILAHNFDYFVSEATAPNSDLEHAVRGLMMFAAENATDQEKQEFVEWLDKKTMLSAMNTALSLPADWFECAEGKTWAEMEEYYINA